MTATGLIVAAGLVLFTLHVQRPEITAEQIPQNIQEVQAVQGTDNTTDAAPLKQPVKHTVLPGETLSAIAEKYNIDVDTLLSANPKAETAIYPGDELVILPGKGVLYTVEEGDTLWGISQAYGVDSQAIQAANHKQDDRLAAGDQLFIPGGHMRRGDPAVSRSGGNVRFIWPTAGEISSPFGYRWGRLHAGIDIANDTGTPVRAARAGQVSFVGWQGGYGMTVMVEHGQGLVTLYGHLSGYAVKSGDYVKTGQLIAYMGSTGYATGPHLHFEVRKQGVPVDPMNLLP